MNRVDTQMIRSRRDTPRRHNPRKRRGAAVLEFAVCLPLLMLLIIGAIEATHALFLKQALSAAAYEGMRTAIEPRSKQSEAQALADNILRSRLVRGATLCFNRVLIQPSAVTKSPSKFPLPFRKTVPSSVASSRIVPYAYER